MGRDGNLGNLTLVLGGVRSGKSRFAENLLLKQPKQLCYLATAVASDGDMAARISLHQARRSSRWSMVETPIELANALLGANQEQNAILVDCLGNWITNLMVHDHCIETYIDNLLAALSTLKTPCVIVSNEVGFGILPDNKMARSFGDIIGLLNQRIAMKANEVYLVVAGCPIMIKAKEERLA